MGQILSQSEVEAILSGLDLESQPVYPASDSELKPIALYDFEHPQPLRQAQLDTLKLASAAGSQALQTSLSRVLLTNFEVTFLGVEQSTYRDYLATAEVPGCIAVFQTANSPDPWLLDLGRPFSFVIIDCLLGGKPFQTDADRLGSRSYTEVETRLIDRALTAIIPDLAATFVRHAALRMTKLIVDGSNTDESTSNDAVALVSFEIASGDNRSLMQFCIPWKDVARPYKTQPEAGPTRFDLQSRAVMIPVVATARVAKLKLPAKDLVDLAAGDVLLTDVPVTQEIAFDVEGRTVFLGNPGQSENRKVIRLTAAVEPDIGESPGQRPQSHPQGT